MYKSDVVFLIHNLMCQSYKFKKPNLFGFLINQNFLFGCFVESKIILIYNVLDTGIFLLV